MRISKPLIRIVRILFIIFFIQTFLFTIWKSDNHHNEHKICPLAEDNFTEEILGYTTRYTAPPEEKDTYMCVELLVAKHPQICIYDPKEDQYISSNLADTGTWEPVLVDKLIKWILNDPELAFIDLGANIGVYTLAVASLGRQVVAVEPSLPHMKRLQKSLYLNNFTHSVTLLRNAISSKRGKVSVTLLKDINRGNTIVEHKNDSTSCDNIKNCDNPDADAIVLNDLIEVINFQKAIMKIDVEGYEMHAFVHAEKLLNKVHIPIILMEWLWFAKNREPSVIQVDKSIPYDTEVNNFIKYLLNKGYRPYSTSMQYLEHRPWTRAWGTDVYWIYNIANVH